MNFGAPELLLILAISALLFGTKKIRSIGSDLGSALRGFRNAMNDDEILTKPDQPSSKVETPTTTESENKNDKPA